MDNQEFLTVVGSSFKKFLETGSRSNEKLKILHGAIARDLKELNDIFDELGIRAKYGASTTWMGKLEYRLKSRRNGGCPILAIGIKKNCIEE